MRSLARLSFGDYEGAVEDARRSIRYPAAKYWPHAHLASALALLDRHKEARIALGKLLELRPSFTLDTALAALSPLNPGALRPLLATWITGLRKAGLDIRAEPPAAG